MSSDKKKLAVIRILGGPAAGREFPVYDTNVSLGRSKESDIVIGDTLLSRKHARITFKEEEWLIEDLKSSNGTWIGAKQILEVQEIENYQRIRAGNSLFEVEFRNVDEESDPSISFSFKPSAVNEHPENIPLEDIRWEHRRLSVMYSLHNQLSAILNEKEIYSSVASALMGEIDADYIYILLYDQKNDKFAPAFGRDHAGKAISAARNPLSSSVLNWVKKKKEAVLSVDPPNDNRFSSDSVNILKTQQVICVPILHQQELLGAIYMAVIKENKKFTEEDLKLQAGIAFSSAMAIMNCRLVKQNIANERMAALGTTAASLSHYIKNILTGIDGCLYLMRMGIDETDEKLMNEAWGILSRNHKRLSGLVMDLLNLAKEQNMDLHIQNICEIIIEAIELVKPNLSSMNIEIGVNKRVLESATMAEIDSQAIHRIILNLMNNAADAINEKFGDKTGGEIKIDLNVTNNNRVVEIKITDNGCGIPQQKIGEVFNMFYSGKGENGTGLGLAVTKKLVEAHKGAISVTSELNKKTSFMLRLPVAHRTAETQLFRRPTL